MSFSLLETWRENSSIYTQKQRLLDYKFEVDRDHSSIITGSPEQAQLNTEKMLNKYCWYELP